MELALTSFGDIATAYAKDVAEGRVVSCKWHRLACERHLKDLERIGSEGFPYIWNPELSDIKGKTYFPADRVCKFAELMPHIKGDWAARGELIKLGSWQIFILASIFGWVHRESFKRRFRIADVIVPRKNAEAIPSDGAQAPANRKRSGLSSSASAGAQAG